jgi:hypothetical protein
LLVLRAYWLDAVFYLLGFVLMRIVFTAHIHRRGEVRPPGMKAAQ